MGQNLDKGKNSAIYPYYHSPPHVNMVMISSTFQMVDLSILAFQSHTLTCSMLSKVMHLWIDMLDYCMIESVEHWSHLSFGAHEYRRI